ncbi:hypothetical protein PYCCODRAFT_649823 [Trametes coccinea BRFM310]|uniref:Uncharacterized protein n=1 Tax=Trametes coccinea (strain BRFM310) TaxID=1353009 RepID=A0A1Y2IIH0_TRAC3|nr:hypothetical protein PYCCODRAFT_649823 [Trametes coccinea BRFM310]
MEALQLTGSVYYTRYGSKSSSSMAIPLFPWFHGIVIIAAAILRVHSLDIRIDDSNATISYSPADQWSQGFTCSGCTIHSDASQAFEGTWHDTTYIPQRSDPMTITFSFIGTAIQVFNILPPVVSAAPTTHTDLIFILDSEVVNSFKADPASGADFRYNVQVFRQDDLENIEHTLTIQTTSGIESVVLFDYLIYTVPDPPPVKPGPIPPPTSSVTPITTTTTTTTTSSSSLGTLSSSTTPASLSLSQSSALLLSPPTSTEPITSSTSSVCTSIPSQRNEHVSRRYRPAPGQVADRDDPLEHSHRGRDRWQSCTPRPDRRACLHTLCAPGQTTSRIAETG